MKVLKISKEDKALIRAYARWCASRGRWPLESKCSRLIENMNSDHRVLVDNYLSVLRLQHYKGDF